ncbi:hypothetical protein Y032_0036g3207 [Ancylostoma ceylanicum]|uniref:Uncharacterized protein n=1 Tax=Ancylostoma ceylanicum TaxID=53326 RepID=A0A016UJM8_9BILA|nr:hypothetical protein Y032_0036g3207 [Ancylostoma ceylanicum]
MAVWSSRYITAPTLLIHEKKLRKNHYLGKDSALEQTEETEVPNVSDADAQTTIEIKTTNQSNRNDHLTEAESTREASAAPTTVESETTHRSKLPKLKQTKGLTTSRSKSSKKVGTEYPSSVKSSESGGKDTEKMISTSSTPSSSSARSSGKPVKEAKEGGLWSSIKKGATNVYETAKGSIANLADRFSKWLKRSSNDSKRAVPKSSSPVRNVRRKKSVGDSDGVDDKTRPGWKRPDDDVSEKSKARLAKAADEVAIPLSPQVKTNETASPKIPVRSTLRQVPFNEPSGKVPMSGSPDAKLPEQGAPSPTLNKGAESGRGDMASAETFPKPDYYRRRDPKTGDEYIVDEPLARDENGRRYMHGKLLPRKKFREENTLKERKEYRLGPPDDMF